MARWGFAVFGSTAVTALWVVALTACSRPQAVLPTAGFSSGSHAAFSFAGSAPSPCATFEPPARSVSGIYIIPPDASGLSGECAVNEALASGEEVMGYGDTPFLWQSLSEMKQSISMPLAHVSSPPNETARFKKLAPAGAPQATVFNGTLPRSVVAAYRLSSQADNKSVEALNTFQGYADSKSVLKTMLEDWQRGNAGLRPNAPAPSETQNPPNLDAHVWMELGSYASSVSINDAGRVAGTATVSFRLYRLNTGNPKYDTFLVTVEGLNKVSGFNNCPYDFPSYYCEWTNTTSNEGLKVNYYLARPNDPRTGVGQITDAQPKNEATTGTYTTSEGATLNAEVNCSVGASAGVEDGTKSTSKYNSCGVNVGGSYTATVTQTWDVKSRSVHNFTPLNQPTADWKMTFNGWNIATCKEKGASLPADFKNAGNFGAATIIHVPRDVIYGSGQPRLMLVASYQGGASAWRYLLSCDGHEARSGNALYQIFELPTFYVSKTALAVPAGGSGQFTINSKRPDIDVGLTPSLWLFKDGEFVKPDSAGLKITADNATAYAIHAKRPEAMPRVQTWTVTALSTAAKATYTLYVDTSPGGETDTTRNGAIPVTLTIK